jgi:subtilase family serine protease
LRQVFGNVFFVLALGAQLGAAQSPIVLKPVPQANRVARAADLSAQMQLHGHLPSWVRADNQASQSVDLNGSLRLTIVMRRDPAVQAAFEKLLADQQDPASPLYHHWLTPQEVGTLFGPTPADVDAVKQWAIAQGLQLQSVAPSRIFLEFTTSVATASSAFRTTFGYFNLQGTARLSASTEPSVPAALAPVIAAINGLSDIPAEPQVQHRSMHAQPGYTVTNSSGTSHFLTPGDFAVIFDVNPVYATGNTGAAIGTKPQHIAIVDESDLVPKDIADFAQKTGISSYTLNTILATGVDPGLGSSQVESTLDVIRTVGTAPGAVSDLVVAGPANGGLYAAASYNVNTLRDPVMTMSWLTCETLASQATDTTWDNLWSVGAAEGITAFVCAGDSGAATCDTHGSAPPATQKLAINAFCASSYATCVGGTEFADTANPTSYWGTTNSSTLTSALGYIPEGAWNEPGTSASPLINATGGGVSLFVSKPSWQTGTGVPADGFRDVPDISLPASGHDGYFGCYNLNCETAGQFEYFYGTSAAAPGMAAIQALWNTRAGSAQGNINPALYRLAASASTNNAFHDATIASSGVNNCTLTVPSMCNNSTPAQTSLTGGQSGYLLTTGYDQVTGWGSLDVANFLAVAAPVTTRLALTPSATSAFTTQPLTFTATLTPAASSLAAPTGTVQFYANGTAFGSAVTLSSNTATSAPQAFSPAGSYSITATYSGDSYFAASTAPAIVITTTVPPPAITIAAGSPSLTFTSGATSGNTVVVTAGSANGFVGAVTLTCAMSTSSAAFQPTCAASPNPVTLASGGTAASTVTITSTTAQAMFETAPRRFGLGSGVTAFATLLLVVLPSRRRKLKWMAVMLCGVLATAALTGCGSKSNPAPASTRSSAGTYTATVTASGSGVSTVTTTFSVTIN